jgi:hypothetical protein
VRIATEDSQQPRFVSEGVHHIPLRVVKRQGDEHWCQEAEAELSLPFACSQGPLLRVVFLQNEVISELIITCHHSLGDGLSVIYLIRDILQEISTPGSRSEILPELPSWEELIPLSQGSVSTNAIAQVTPKRKIAASNAGVVLNRASDKAVWSNPVGVQGDKGTLEGFSSLPTTTRDKEAIEASSRSSILYWCLSPEETARLVSRCRENQASVQSAICAAFLLSIAQQMNWPEQTSHECLSPCNVRKYLVPEIGEDFGLYICSLLSSHILKPETSFWELAQEVKHKINEWTAGKLFDDIPKSTAYLSTQPDPQTVYQQMDEKIKLVITNLGRLNIPQQYGSLYLEAIYGPTAQGSENAKTVGVTTLGGKMFLTLTFSESVLPRSLAEKIQRAAMQRISEALGSETHNQGFELTEIVVG